MYSDSNPDYVKVVMLGEGSPPLSPVLSLSIQVEWERLL